MPFKFNAAGEVEQRGRFGVVDEDLVFWLRWAPEYGTDGYRQGGRESGVRVGKRLELLPDGEEASIVRNIAIGGRTLALLDYDVDRSRPHPGGRSARRLQGQSHRVQPDP